MLANNPEVARASSTTWPPIASLSGAPVKAGVPTWTPNQLRHAAATEIRKRYGLQAAQTVLGHADMNVTEWYAEKDFDQARKVMAEFG